MSEWSLTPHSTRDRSFRNESFQADKNCAGTDNQAHNCKKIRPQKHKKLILRQTNWPGSEKKAKSLLQKPKFKPKPTGHSSRARTAHMRLLMTVHSCGTQYSIEQLDTRPFDPAENHRCSEVVCWNERAYCI